MNTIDELNYLEELVASQEYLATAARTELDKVKKSSSPTSYELIRARALIHAHIGMNDYAIQELNALVSDSDGDNPQLLNKLAQVRLRRQIDDDVSAARAAANRVLEIHNLSLGDKWLAYQNLALASWASGNIEEAKTEANMALNQIDDPRTRKLLALISDGAPVASFLNAQNISKAHTNGEHGELNTKALVQFVSAMEPMM